MIMGMGSVGHAGNLGLAVVRDKPWQGPPPALVVMDKVNKERCMRLLQATRRLAAAVVCLGLAAAAPAAAQVSVEKIKVHSPAIEGNLEGNSADRDVIVVLPPSYAKDKDRRYPVVYFLHGYFAKAEMYDGLVKFGEAMEGEAAKGNEMILVVPDSYTRFGGSMYSNSVATGNFEGFIARDLVAHVDSHYRTIASRSARGLSGHSMGGYGTLKIAMKYPQVFSSIYAMSACCLSARTLTPEEGGKLEAVSIDQALNAEFGARAGFAVAAAWSPNPQNPPFYADLGSKDGAIQPHVLAQWAANAPNAMLPQYVPELKSHAAIALDVGDKDFLLADNVTMHELMGRFGIAHQWTVYEGDHGNRVAARFRSDLLPFFAKHLAVK
jgi:S-formylglutathione hydrolase FrmB